jgi:hypothetical protein
MTIRYKCEECGAVLNIKDELAGTLGHCPRCKVEFKVPVLDEKAVAGKEPAAVGTPAAEGQNLPTGAFSEDDIESILQSPGPAKSTSDYGVADDDDEPPADDETDEKETKKKRKGRSDKVATAKSDSAESAAIAKNLMGRGDHSAGRDEKKGGRPFGGADGGRDEVRQEFTTSEVARYFAKRTWPLFLGLVAFVALCYWLYTSLSPGVNLPALVPVSGTVTLDGKPLAKAMVKFQPIPEPGAKANLFLAAPVGETDDHGKYELLYLVVNEKRVYGAPLGKHLVVINAADKQGGELLPSRYSYPPKSILSATVVKGMPPQNFDLKSGEETTEPAQ